MKEILNSGYNGETCITTAAFSSTQADVQGDHIERVDGLLEPK